MDVTQRHPLPSMRAVRCVGTNPNPDLQTPPSLLRSFAPWLLRAAPRLRSEEVSCADSSSPHLPVLP